MQTPLDDLIRAVELDAMPRSQCPEEWTNVWQALPWQPVAYAASMLDYQQMYMRSAGWTVADLAMVLYCDRRPCGLWPLTVSGPPGALRVTSSGGAILPPLLLPNLARRTVKRMLTRTLALIHRIGNTEGVSTAVLEQSPQLSNESIGTTEWHRLLMEQGSTPTVRHDLYLDLRPEINEIRAGVRKSYRPLISSGSGLWRVFVMDGAAQSTQDWNDFQSLHAAVSGRVTRNAESWGRQLRMIKENEAILVGLRDPLTERLVGGGFFQFTRDESLYSVGAYDRSLFDKPLGHVVQWRGIQELKARGVRWHRVGERMFPQDNPSPTEKQSSIVAFKEGFASHLLARFEFMLPALGLSPAIESEE